MHASYKNSGVIEQQPMFLDVRVEADQDRWYRKQINFEEMLAFNSTQGMQAGIMMIVVWYLQGLQMESPRNFTGQSVFVVEG